MAMMITCFMGWLCKLGQCLLHSKGSILVAVTIIFKTCSNFNTKLFLCFYVLFLVEEFFRCFEEIKIYQVLYYDRPLMYYLIGNVLLLKNG